MKKKVQIKILALAAMLAASSTVMAANPPQGPGVVMLNNTVGNLWTASIGDTPIMGAFTDVFTLTPNATPGSVAWGSVINTSFFGMANITFTAADLNGIPLITAAVPMGPVTFNAATLLPSTVVGPLTLTIHGMNTGGGSYGGDINVTMAPVPEPETYALLLGGLGILAMLSRRRKPE